MKPFIIRAVCFFTLLAAVCCGLWLLGDKVDAYVNANSRFELKKKTEVLLLGHSHSECAFNDSIITGLSNMSYSAESYFYSFIKLRKILEENDALKYILIEYSNINVTGKMNDWMWGNASLSYRYPIYSPFMTPDEKSFLFSKNKTYSFTIRIKSAIQNCATILLRDFDYTKKTGGYFRLARITPDSILLHRGKLSEALDDTLSSKENIACLKQIIEYCHRKKKKIYLVRSPVHKYLYTKNSEPYFQSLLNTQFKDVPFIDFKNYPLTNAEFGDLDHLNFSGASKFSKSIDSLFESGFLSHVQNGDRVVYGDFNHHR